MNKKQNLGFTLIELLAVIVVLAIIMVIATPIVIKTIEDAKMGSFRNAALGIIKGAELGQTKDLLNGKKVEKTVYTYDNGTETSTNSSKLDYRGTPPQNGTIIVDKDGKVALAIHDGAYCAEKTYEDSEVIVSKKEVDKCIISIPSKPEFSNGMIPIKWDGSKWVKADKNSKWYDYNAKEWANVVLVTETERNTYINAAPGTEIKEIDVLAYLVWIPRYRYKLFNVNATSISPQEIEIVFEDRDTSKSNGSTNGTWLTHPAFTFGDDELNGVWVGKFETTGNATTPTIKPGVVSLRNQDVSTQFATSQKFNNNLTYGLSSTSDAHMMKNMEWGAVIYLSYSKYGKNEEIWINPSSSYITGCAGTGPSVSNSSGCSYHYTTSNGRQASTTGNVYGIYDMSGGAWEYVMGGMYNSDGATIMLLLSGFNQTTIDGTVMEKYIDKYKYGTTSDNQTAFNRRKLGDATGETRGWYSDYAFFVVSDWSWTLRGGTSHGGANAGVFGFSSDNGVSLGSGGFRLTIARISD